MKPQLLTLVPCSPTILVGIGNTMRTDWLVSGVRFSF
jgi:hypothetical protein